jgi:hypothetical protein
MLFVLIRAARCSQWSSTGRTLFDFEFKFRPWRLATNSPLSSRRWLLAKPNFNSKTQPRSASSTSLSSVRGCVSASCLWIRCPVATPSPLPARARDGFAVATVSEGSASIDLHADCPLCCACTVCQIPPFLFELSPLFLSPCLRKTPHRKPLVFAATASTMWKLSNVSASFAVIPNISCAGRVTST